MVEYRDKLAKLRKARATSGHLGRRAEARLPGLLLERMAAMLKCVMSGGQVKGGAALVVFPFSRGKSRR